MSDLSDVELVSLQILSDVNNVSDSALDAFISLSSTNPSQFFTGGTPECDEEVGDASTTTEAVLLQLVRRILNVPTESVERKQNVLCILCNLTVARRGGRIVLQSLEAVDQRLECELQSNKSTSSTLRAMLLEVLLRVSKYRLS